MQDDRLAARSMAVAHWVEYMTRDADKARDDHMETLWCMEMVKLIAAFGKGSTGNLWTRV